MDFALTEQQELIRKEVAALARTFSLDYWLEKDRKAEYPTEFVKAFADNGWLGLMIPEAYGGAGLGVNGLTRSSILGCSKATSTSLGWWPNSAVTSVSTWTVTSQLNTLPCIAAVTASPTVQPASGSPRIPTSAGGVRIGNWW